VRRGRKTSVRVVPPASPRDDPSHPWQALPPVPGRRRRYRRKTKTPTMVATNARARYSCVAGSIGRPTT